MFNYISNKLQYFTLLLFLLFFNFSYSQLTSFSLQLTVVNESCAGNGLLSFNITNQTSGSTILYSVFALPNDVTPIAIISENNLGGLVAGDYKVIATQTLGVESNSQEQNVTILSQIEILTFNLISENEICSNDGKVIVNVTQGNGVSFEVFSGPITRPLQTSNIFTGLTTGLYQIRAFDSCGEGIVQSVFIGNTNTFISFRHQSSNSNCNEIEVVDFLESPVGSIISYPITVEYIITPPSGIPIVYTQSIVSGNINSQGIVQLLPLYYGEIYSYIINVTDSCGNIYTNNPISINPIVELMARLNPVSCSDKSLELRLNDFGVSPFVIDFISAPVGFDPLLYNTSHPVANFTSFAIYYNPSVQLLPGYYNIKITDSCGRIAIKSIYITFDPLPLYPVAFYQLPGCELGYGSVRVVNNLYGIIDIEITSAPVQYLYALPHNLSGNLISSSLYLENLPPGNYIFKTIDQCGRMQFTSVVIIGNEVFSNLINIIEHCNSFDIQLQHDSSISASETTFWLQKLDTSTNQWVHPETNAVFANDINATNAILLYNNSTNYNFIISGEYRIIKKFRSYRSSLDTNGLIVNNCFEEIYSFEYNAQTVIKNVYSFDCTDNTYDVILDAVGFEPLLYRITTKNSIPFFVDNGLSPIFTGLTSAIYNFQVEDACGNILNRLFEINEEFVFLVTALDLCDGENSLLSVPYFSFLQYQWWKGSDTSTIINTSNILDFTPFNSASDFGVYHVRISNPNNSNSCIDFILDYEISTGLNNPNSGNGLNITYCGNQGILDLFDFLAGTYDLTGNWQEITNSGLLNNNLWDSSIVSPGLYSFRYRVNGLCGSFDESQVNITIKAIPESPLASIDPILCELGDLRLYASDVIGANYEWNGPNGFTSNMQNPVITNVSSLNQGVYFVKALLQGCESEVSNVIVSVESLPQFKIKRTCNNGISLLSVEPNETSSGQVYTNYLWTFPNGITQIGNSINISGNEIGTYSVKVQNQYGCSVVKTTNVRCTSCGDIPKGISANADSLNDTFDLTCLDEISNVKIFNRYGILVFEKDNYIADWKGYDYRGVLLPTGTYYYLIKFKSGESKTGWVYLNY
jgi:gliding motility-associated-like protein